MLIYVVNLTLSIPQQPPILHLKLRIFLMEEVYIPDTVTEHCLEIVHQTVLRNDQQREKIHISSVVLNTALTFTPCITSKYTALCSPRL